MQTSVNIKKSVNSDKLNAKHSVTVGSSPLSLANRVRFYHFIGISWHGNSVQ